VLLVLIVSWAPQPCAALALLLCCFVLNNLDVWGSFMVQGRPLRARETLPGGDASGNVALNLDSPSFAPFPAAFASLSRFIRARLSPVTEARQHERGKAQMPADPVEAGRKGGRIGGRSKSPAKIAAAKRNGFQPRQPVEQPAPAPEPVTEQPAPSSAPRPFFLKTQRPPK
jgi:hypothetical protein